MTWRDELRPPSFRGAPFKIEANTRFGGRRGFTYEFANGERSLDEDLGRRVTRVAVSGYVIGDDYLDKADALEAALNRPGAGLLVLSTMGQATMRCETFQRIETKDQGGMARFEMAFVRSQVGASAPSGQENTQAASATAATSLADAAEQSANKPSDWKGAT